MELYCAVLLVHLFQTSNLGIKMRALEQSSPYDNESDRMVTIDSIVMRFYVL